MHELNHRAVAIGDLLLERMGEWLAENVIGQLCTETGYAVRWYIFQLREAGYVIEAVKSTAPALFRGGARGYQLTDIQDAPYRPLGARPVAQPASVKSAVRTIQIGSRVEHPILGRGRVTFAAPTASKVVVKFRRRKRVERVERVVLALIN